MAQPPSFFYQQHPSHVCKLQKALYGLKQAPCAWYHELHQFFISTGFGNSRVNTSLFIYNKFGLTIYLLVYVDDLILTENNDDFLIDVISQLANKFSIKYLVTLSFFLGIEVVTAPSGLFLLQTRYIQTLLERAKIQDAKSVHSRMSTSQIPKLHDGIALTNPTEYQSIVGGL